MPDFFRGDVLQFVAGRDAMPALKKKKSLSGGGGGGSGRGTLTLFFSSTKIKSWVLNIPYTG